MAAKPTAAKIREARRNLCKDLKMINQLNDKEAGRQEAAGDSNAAAESARQADRAKADAAKWGCKWAQ